MQDKIALNKKNAMAFYDMAFNECEPEKAVELFVGEEFTQHNAQINDGKEAFIEYFTRIAAEFPGKQVAFKRAIAEDNMAVLHCHQIWPGDQEYATVEIFRFDDSGKIIEHWNVMQAVPAQSLNENTVF